MIRIRNAALALLLAVALPHDVRAQVSLVPAAHPVYEWLHHQRVLGHVPGFAFELLPLSRGEIHRLLVSLEGRSNAMSGPDRALLQAFRREFGPEALAEASGEGLLAGGAPLGERLARVGRGTREPHLFVRADTGFAVAVDGLLALGAFTGEHEGPSGTAALPEVGLRAYADARDRIGGHAEVARLLSSGDVRAVRHDPRYGRTPEVVEEGGGGAWYVEASASLRYGPVSVDVGRGALRMGAGFGEPLILSPLASGIPWARLRFITPRFRYTSLHAGLHNPADSALILHSDGTTTSFAASARHLALRRLEVILHPSLLLAFTESLVYSARPIDFAYINPMNVLFFAEIDNEDRDNVLWAADMTWRPLPRLELYGTLFADDLVQLIDFLPSLDDEPNRDRAFDWGVSLALPAAVDLSARYVRIEPFVYTHWQRFNHYELNGFPLGHSVGPNADRWLVRARRWLSGRGWVAASFSSTRKGLNPLGPGGEVVSNVGGDVTLGSGLDPVLRLLEGADVQAYREYGIEAEVEPWRGVRLSAAYRVRDVGRGTRVGDVHALTLGVALGY